MYGMDIRDRIVQFVDVEGMTLRGAAARLAIAPSTAIKIYKRFETTGSVEPTRKKPPRAKLLAWEADVRAIVDADPDATLVEIAAAIEERTGVKVGKSSVDRFLKSLDFTRKKKTVYADEVTRKDVAKRRGWFRTVVQSLMDHAAFYFVDETSVTLDMTRGYGRAPRGERCIASAPYLGRSTSTLVAAMGAAGVVAPMVFSGAVKRDDFIGWLRGALAPKLPSGAVVLMDNASVHKGKAVDDALRSFGLVPLYLPAYSPDMNPIELFNSTLKEALRGACARTRQALDDAIAAVLKVTDAKRCANFFRHCGYDSL